MKVIILTSISRGTASRSLPTLYNNKNIEIVGVVLARNFTLNRRKYFLRKLKKTLNIGFLGALNGIRIRSWYADRDVIDIKDLCRNLGIKFYHTPSINCERTKEIFRKSNATLGLSLGNSFITESIFSIPKYGMINVHTEILPEFQGAQAIIWPIHNCLNETGFTIHQVNRKIDSGQIIFQAKYPIKFEARLRDTVKKNLQKARDKVPLALSYVCENYEALKQHGVLQKPGKSYTTPSIWQFLKILRIHRKFYRKSINQ